METGVVASLSRWGVSVIADLVYRALDSYGPWSIEQIGSSLELKPGRVSMALDELQAIGAAVPIEPGSSGNRRWRSLPSTGVIAGLQQRQEQVAAARHRLRQRLMRLALPDCIPDPGALSVGTRALFGIGQVRGRLAELIAAERHEHLAMNPEPAFNAETVRAAAPLNRSLHARGITVKTLGVPATNEDQSGWHRDELNGYGLAYRQLSQLPSKIMILDRRTAILPIDPVRLSVGAWEISVPAVVEQLIGLFHHHWARADVPGRDWIPPVNLTPREQAVLALLARGYTDAAVAAKLDVSVRTIAYTISGLMDRYHVSNRFQLGLVLGAVTSDPGTAPSDQSNMEQQ